MSESFSTYQAFSLCSENLQFVVNSMTSWPNDPGGVQLACTEYNWQASSSYNIVQNKDSNPDILVT